MPYSFLGGMTVALLLAATPLLQAQSSVAEWQAKAIKAYPALGERDSDFNREFLKLYQARKAEVPAFFEQADWPWTLASQVAATQGITALEEAPAEAPEVAVAPLPPEPETTPEPTTAQPEAESGVDQTSEWEADQIPEALGLEFARFRWWAPGGVPLRGIFVLAPGRGGDGRGMAGNAKWQAIAREQHFAIVACFLKNRADAPHAYQKDPNGGTSRLIDRAIEALGEAHDLKTKSLPLFFYGHSAGGNVSQKYGNQHPRRMIGAVIMRCPSGSGSYSPAKGDVPMLIYVGAKDRAEWVKYSLERYEEGARKRAVWTLAMHPNEGHGVGNTWALTEGYVHDVINQRLGKPGPGSVATPRRLSRQQGWLGDPATYEVAPASQFKGKKQEAIWLPDEATALLWQSYLK